MNIHVHSIVYNEERMLPFFLDHYYRFANKVFLYDNGSDDQTVAIAERWPGTVVIPHDTGGEFSEMPNLHLKNNAWKERSRGQADWVIVCDADEFIYHPDILGYLAGCTARGVTVPRPTGYWMTSPSFPEAGRPITEQVRKGRHSAMWSKAAVFNPSLEEIGYGPGCHGDGTGARGQVVFDDDPEFKLLHMAFLGLDWIKWRWGRNAARRCWHDRQVGFSIHAVHFVEQAEGRFADDLANCHEVI